MNTTNVQCWSQQADSQASGSARSHLYASLRQVDADGQPLPHADVWVLCLLEGFLQGLQLRHRERRAAAALLLLVAVPSLQNQLWQDGEGQRKCHQQNILSSQQKVFSNLL